MNKTDLVTRISATTGHSRRITSDTLDTFIATVLRAIAEGEKVAIAGLGTFDSRMRAPRTARNPRTGATLTIPATTVPVFRPARDLKDAAAGKRRRAKR